MVSEDQFERLLRIMEDNQVRLTTLMEQNSQQFEALLKRLDENNARWQESHAKLIEYLATQATQLDERFNRLEARLDATAGQQPQLQLLASVDTRSSMEQFADGVLIGMTGGLATPKKRTA